MNTGHYHEVRTLGCAANSHHQKAEKDDPMSGISSTVLFADGRHVI
jgi:hypothetical protein